MKKVLYGLLLICSLLFVACQATTTPTYTISYHTEEDTSVTTSKSYNENTILNKSDIRFEKSGYELEDWYYDADHTNKVVFPYTVTKNDDFYALWVKLFTVTLMNHQTVLETKTIKDGQTLADPGNPQITGAGPFKGWSSDETTYTPFDFTTVIHSDLKLYAFFDAVATETVSVSFMNGTTLLETKTVNKNTAVEAITSPTKEGHTFKGWSTDATTYTAFDFETLIESDLSLYAFFDINQYTVTYMCGTEVYHTDSVSYNTCATAPQDPNIIGSTFISWCTDEAGEHSFDFTTPITENITLYAKLETVNTHTLHLIVDGTQTDKLINNNALISTVSTPSKEGYTFMGWYTDASYQNAFDSTTPITEDKTLYGYFQIKTYTVTFKNGTATVSTKTVNHNAKVTAPSNPTKTGYTFKGWSTNATTYTEFDTTTKTITENVTLYAFFDINQYTVTFMNGSVKYDTQKVNYNDTVAIPANPTQTGKSFRGWSTSSTSYVAFNENTKITSDRTLYAFFITKYTVTFNVDGVKTSVEVEENATVTKPAEDPSKSGYSFVGWTYNDNEFNFNTPITENIELVASFVAVQIEISRYGAYDEGLFFEATPVSGASLSDYQVQYKLSTSSSSNWNTVDSALIREENNKIRCDIVGLSAGTYDVKLNVNGKTETKSYEVTAADRSGYAHFNYSGVGAYNDDGTLKSNAVVVYVTNENKNTVTAEGYTGLVNIIKNQSKIKKPLAIRIIGKITTNQYAYKSDAPRLPDGTNNTSTFFTNSLETTYGENLVGLTVQYMDKLAGKSYKFLTTTTGLASNGTGDSSKKTTTYSRTDYPALTGQTVLDDDSYFNMLDIELASNITIEGIGTNAEFFQFGLTWKKCNSIEVKNLTFTDYPEDACSFEAGSNSDVNDYGHYWVHNNTFNRGKNNWDVSGERDKYAGDGGIDVKYINSVTLAYNKFNNCKKTGLVGGDNKNYTKNITFHHNYYYNVESRLPLGRQANMHIYNNYYESCGTCQDIRANAFVFSEANYFDGCTTAQKVTTDSETYTGTVIKSYNDYYNGSSKQNTTQATKVNSRTQSLTGNCKPDGSTDYTNFDTNSTLFYYTGSASNVTLLHKNTDVPAYCKSHSGAGVLKSTTAGNTSTEPAPTPSETWTNKLTETFSTNKTPQAIEMNVQIPTGISYCTDATDTSQNNATIENGALHINDTSNKTTWCYYTFDQQNPTSGKVRVSVDFTIPVAGTKWTILTFRDGNGDIMIRTNDQGKLGYVVNGERDASNNLVVTPIESSSIVANTVYTVTLIVDYSAGTATVQINDTTMTLSNYTVSGSILGLSFMTAASATNRSFTVDNIKVDWA